MRIRALLSSVLSVLLLCCPSFGARHFNGTSDVITLANTSGQTDFLGNDMSLTAWVRCGSSSTNDAIVARWDGAHNQYLFRLFQTTGTNREIFNAWGGATHITSFTFAADGVTWHFIAMTLSSTNHGAAMDANYNGNTGGIGTLTDSTQPTLIGASGVSGSYFKFASCDIAEVGFWNANFMAGSAETNLLKSMSHGVPPLLVYWGGAGTLKGYLPLYGASSPEMDFSKGHSNGTLTGTTVTSHAPVAPTWMFGIQYW
jgi:hypothetical protein